MQFHFKLKNACKNQQWSLKFQFFFSSIQKKITLSLHWCHEVTILTNREPPPNFKIQGRKKKAFRNQASRRKQFSSLFKPPSSALNHGSKKIYIKPKKNLKDQGKIE
jgi:hypothetical protein